MSFTPPAFHDDNGNPIREGDVVVTVQEDLPDCGKLAHINNIIGPCAYVCLGLYRNLHHETSLGTAKALRKYYVKLTDIRLNAIQDPLRVLNQEFDL